MALGRRGSECSGLIRVSTRLYMLVTPEILCFLFIDSRIFHFLFCSDMHFFLTYPPTFCNFCFSINVFFCPSFDFFHDFFCCYFFWMEFLVFFQLGFVAFFSTVLTIREACVSKSLPRWYLLVYSYITILKSLDLLPTAFLVTLNP